MNLAIAEPGLPSPQALLDVLRLLTLPRHVVCIGPGNPRAPWVRWMLDSDIDKATLVDGSEENVRSLEPVLSGRPAWKVHHRVIGLETGSAIFHTAQLSSESGLIDPDALHSLWPNLRSRQSQEREAVSLGDLLRLEVSTLDWLIVDCLPAARMLASVDLTSLDVSLVVTRCVSEVADLSGLGASRDECDAVLQDAGFRRLGCTPERHPALCHAYYIREVDERHPRVKALVTAAIKRPAERLKQLEVQQSELKQRVDELEHQRKTLTEQLAASTKLARELLEQGQEWQRDATQSERLRADLAAASARLQAEAVDHAQALKESQQARKQAEQLVAQRQQQVKALDQKVSQLQIQLADAERLNLRLRGEVEKAEAQIGLVREFLLPGPPQ